MKTLNGYDLIRFESREEILDLEGLDLSCSVTTDNFERIIGYFLFKEKERCQVLMKYKNCNHLYNFGWVVGIQGGKKAMIGCDCADDKFDVSEKYRIESSRARYAMKRDEGITRLKFYWYHKDVTQQWLNLETKRIAGFQDRLRKIGDCLPRSIRSKCVDMQKTGRRTVVVELKYVEKDENGKEHIDWVSINAGVLHNTHIWVPGFLEGYRKRIFDARSALLESLHCDDNTDNRQLSKWLKSLEDIQPLINELDRFEDDLAKFCSMENMVTLYLMTKSQEFRANIARAYFISRNEVPTNDRCTALVEQIEAIVEDRTEGKEFRMVA